MRSFAIITVILLIAAAAIFVLKQHTGNNPPQPVANASAPAAAPAAPKKQNPPQDWNETGVAWQTFEAGMQQAREQNKPVCLVFYAEWCPHCRNYGKVFHDAGIIEKSKNFVMIRIDVDKDKDVADAFRPDGTYVPRTYFLSSRGVSDYSLLAAEPPPARYKYFYKESDPASLSAGMDRALKKLK